MSKSEHRAGGKITNSHSTLIPEAAFFVDEAVKIEEVKKISIGIIKPIKSKRATKLKLKINKSQAGSLLCSVRGVVGVQELRLFTDDVGIVADRLSKIADSKGIEVN